ncbi:RVT_3 domain-containing protein [Cephalotus follicularis]|uniref:RVT_3 domain-containing protein n=1 Tax=Cephalotus follicularis TaxID=3775 RepID=A0A1Q3BDD8_CEPFO|nr:RVT_3 domain-containing protein [Cephalotus follicularis]
MRRTCNKDGFGFVLCLLWRIWYNRNTQTFEKKGHDPGAVSSFCYEYLLEFNRVNQLKKNQPSLECLKWKSPPDGFIKLNCGYLGWACRDSLGIVFSAGFKRLDCSLEPLGAKTLAMLSRISFAQRLGYAKVIVESDALITIDEVNSEKASRASYGGIIEDIKSLKPQFV